MKTKEIEMTLKPCPFCDEPIGTVSFSDCDGTSNKHYIVGCGYCGVYIQSDDMENGLNEVYVRWNTRFGIESPTEEQREFIAQILRFSAGII